jgi:hypothetical protein
VDDDAGPIQNGWRLLLPLSNPLMMRAEAVLYHETHRWQLESPTTAMSVETNAGPPIGSRKAGVRLHEAMRRSDTFHFMPNLPEGWRGWGRVVTTVDGQRWECPVPSSLFQYAHGKAAAEHPQRFWPREPE